MSCTHTFVQAAPTAQNTLCSVSGQENPPYPVLSTLLGPPLALMLPLHKLEKGALYPRQGLRSGPQTGSHPRLPLSLVLLHSEHPAQLYM